MLRNQRIHLDAGRLLLSEVSATTTHEHACRACLVRLMQTDHPKISGGKTLVLWSYGAVFRCLGKLVRDWPIPRFA